MVIRILSMRLTGETKIGRRIFSERQHERIEVCQVLRRSDIVEDADFVRAEIVRVVGRRIHHDIGGVGKCPSRSLILPYSRRT